jgi:transposase
MFANMLDIFSMISGVDESYKTIERLDSDNEVITTVHYLHILILKEKDVKNSDAIDEGTRYSMTVKKSYESSAQKLKDLAKENPDHEKDGKESKSHKRRLFAYSFAIMDLETRLNIAFGSSIKWEREAYVRTMDLLLSIGIDLDSIRMNRSYSSPSFIYKLGDTRVFAIPKKNVTLKG